MSTTLSVRDLRFAYDDRVVIGDLNVTFGPGLHYLIGENGVGKTTLLTLMLGLRTPQRGRIELETPTGQWHTGPALRAHIGYLPQSFSFPRRFSALEFVMHVGWLKGLPRGRLRAAASSALELVGLGDRADERMERLSGGMLRRAGIAQALVAEPPVLLLDEPTASLSPAQRVELRTLVATLAARVTVVVSTHQLEDVRHGDHHIVALGHQKVLFDGPTSRLLARRPGAPSSDLSDIEAAFIALSDDT